MFFCFENAKSLCLLGQFDRAKEGWPAGRLGSLTSLTSRPVASAQIHRFTQQDDGNCLIAFQFRPLNLTWRMAPSGHLLLTVWASSPDHLEMPQNPFLHHSNCSDSPCVSESGSNIFSKRE
ncbi:hypothetical protein M0R45_007537 [Rubus argutus]|uniref:Uncharacterized protein n=1 Tax=Rubus argutus TaxID=59490 RepID=A0AAW1XYU2_RUBAR